MAMHTLYGVLAFTEDNYKNICRFIFLCLFVCNTHIAIGLLAELKQRNYCAAVL